MCSDFLSLSIYVKYVTKAATLWFLRVTIEPWGKDFRDYLIESGSEKLIKLAELMELGHFLLDGLEIAMKEK